jgi:hypothetical protein
MQIKGSAKGLGKAGRGRLRVKGITVLPADMADLTVAMTDLLDEVGNAGELVDTSGATLPLTLVAKKVKAKKAIFETEAGVQPRVRVILRRKKADSEDLKVTVKVRGAYIARPSSCEGSENALLETGLSLNAGGEVTRMGAIADWRCKKKLLRSG